MVNRKTLSQPSVFPQTRELEPLMTIKEVQKILQLSKPKIYALMRRELPSLKIDGARRFERAKLQAWIECQNETLQRG